MSYTGIEKIEEALFEFLTQVSGKGIKVQTPTLHTNYSDIDDPIFVEYNVGSMRQEERDLKKRKNGNKWVQYGPRWWRCSIRVFSKEELSGMDLSSKIHGLVDSLYKTFFSTKGFIVARKQKDVLPLGKDKENRYFQRYFDFQLESIVSFEFELERIEDVEAKFNAQY